MKKALFFALIGVLFCLVTPGIALAEDSWTATLVPSSVETYIAGDELKVVVAPAGPDASDAADSLRAALDEVARVALVMDAGSLGDVSSLPDEDIVKKSENLPVDLIAIVRVFGESAPKTSVVTFYLKDGTAHSALTATEGKPLTPNKETPTAKVGQGISSTASDAVASSSDAAVGNRKEAIDEFSEKFVWFQDWTVHSGQTGAYMGGFSIPFRGKYREPLEGAEFYEAVDRPDLADEYRSNSRIKTALTIPAYITGLAGVGLLTWGVVRGISQGTDTEYNETTMEWEDTGKCFTCDNWQLWTGIAGVSVSAILSIVNGTIDLYPTDASGSRRLADEFNKSLAAELGLSDDMSERENLPIDGSETQGWNFDLQVSPGGVSATVEF